MVWNFLGSAVGALGSLFGGISAKNQANKQFKYAKWAQKEEWQRQDNQLQRLTADAKLAGVSQLAALGAGGNYAAPTQTASAPVVDPYSGAAQQLGKGIAGIKTRQAAERVGLENDLLKAQIEQVRASTRNDTVSTMATAARNHTIVSARNTNQDGASAPLDLMVDYRLPDGRIVKGPNPAIAELDQAAFAKGYQTWRDLDPSLDSGTQTGKPRRKPGSQKRPARIHFGNNPINWR